MKSFLDFKADSYNYEGKVKSSRPSLRETEDKRPLGRDLDRSWCDHHTSIKLLMDPWRERSHTCMLPPMSMEPWAVTKKLYASTAVTPAPVRVPIQWPLVLSFKSVVG